MLTVDERVQAVCEAAWGLLPPLKRAAWITKICVEDLGAKHGNYAMDDGVLTLSTRLFIGRNAAELLYIDCHGDSPPVVEPYCARALHTVLHEAFHAICAATGIDSAPEWLALSGWQRTPEDLHSTGRYTERRPGWGTERSEWRYRKSGTWFIREYSSKSPFEDAADGCTHIALGWHRPVSHPNGRRKLRYLMQAVWDQDGAAQLQACAAHWRQRFQAQGRSYGRL